MAFVDEIKIYAEAGRGGDGVVRWRREKFVPKGGPAGGDGGRGGDFYIEAVRDVGILSTYQAKKEFFAGRGEDGAKKSLHGAKGNDFILKLPIGSTITNLDSGESWTLTEEGQQIKILTGGRGGWGNEHFKKSTNTTPEESTEGRDGEKGNFIIELDLFADIGLVGLPNAGKSSLLNSLTNAQAKVGDYAFTTLDPNLGSFYGFIIADIPGLIEGASEGKGLGIKFLRHIKRTKMLAHLISFENMSKGKDGMMQTYEEIRTELKNYDKKTGSGLSDKKEIIVLTKSDLIKEQKDLEREIAVFEKLGKPVFVLSLFDDVLVKEFADNLVKLVRV